MSRLSELRTKLAKEKDPKVAKELISLKQKLLALKEDYPELKANAQFTKLYDELVLIEHKITHTRSFFNDCVAAYNNRINRIPDILLAKFFGFKEIDFYEALSATLP